MSDDFFDPSSASDAPAKTAEAADPSAHRLETKFEDPPAIFSLTDAEPVKSVTEEASDAIQELLMSAGTTDMSQNAAVAVPEFTPDSLMDFTPESASLAAPDKDSGPIVMSGETAETELLGAKLRLYEELSALILCEYSFDVLVEKGLQALMRSIDAQAGSIFEFDSTRDDFFFRACRGGAADKVKSFRVPAKQGIVGFVSESRQALLINDLQDDERQLKSISVAVGFEARSCLAAPILVAGKLYGVVEVFNKMGTLYFHERDKGILMEGICFFAKALEVRFFVAELVGRKAGTAHE